MDIYEQAVLDYLCARPERFVNAQFAIPYDGFRGGSCPDFVVVDFGARTVFVVEVTASSDCKNVVGRVQERKTRWFGPIRAHMKELNPMFETWDYHVTLFVREEEVKNAQRRVANFQDVSVISLSDVVFSWNWKWQPENGLPTNVLRDQTKRGMGQAASHMGEMNH
ncbi:hypothetical protein HYR69_02800 [Candidatus Sumerlaeota bacterium]|nr:hypothetical protein [Candidatus Sumerlaeota bacterium]